MSYGNKIRSARPQNLIAYWPLNERSGTQVTDLSGNGYHGVLGGGAAAPTLGALGIGDSNTAYSFDGGDVANIYTAGLASALNGSEGTLFIWAKVSGAGVWGDSTLRELVRIRNRATEDNMVILRRSSANNQLDWRYSANGTVETISLGSLSDTDWFSMALTWSASADQVKAYRNGAQAGATQTGLGTFLSVADSTTQWCIGAATTAPANPWSGSLAHCALWSAALTAAEILNLTTGLTEQGGAGRGKKHYENYGDIWG